MSLERIEITPFALIAGEVLRDRRNGHLTIVRGQIRRSLYWSQGELVLIASDDPAEGLGEYLARRGALTAAQAAEAFAGVSPVAAVSRFHETASLPLAVRQTLLRDWLKATFIPLFSHDEGTAVFTEDAPIPPEQRVFLLSTAALILEGIRSITNGLVLRRCLGDMKREIEPARDSNFAIESLALNEVEQRIAASLTAPTSIESFIKQFGSESTLAGIVVIGMMALGVFAEVDHYGGHPTMDVADMQRDLELLAAIGSGDPRSLRAAAFSRQIPAMDHYQVLDVPRAAARNQILTAGESLKKIYSPSGYPPILAESLQTILKRVDEALHILLDPGRRAVYDKMLTEGAGRPGASAGTAMRQRATQRSIAAQNFNRARELASEHDYYGAIVLLKQTVNYAPELADAWVLLGSCQQHNPKWRRDAAESYQMALSIDPNHIDALISLGDLYRAEGLTSRAQTCYEDALRIAPDNPQADSRLKALKKK